MKALRVLALLLATMLIAAAAPLVAADDVEGSDSATGKVTVTATAPQVSFALYSDKSYQTPTTEITPQTPVYMMIDVSGKNPLEEYTITVHIFADNDNSAVGTIPTETSPETYVKFTISYDSNSGQWVLTADTGNSNTWSIELNKEMQQPDPTAAAGEFYINITFGKTAREANTLDTSVYADWDIIVEATVAGTATGTASDYGYRVYFYSELTVNAETIDFGTLEAGNSSFIQSVDGDTTQNYFTITVIANGYYDVVAASSSTWQTSDSAYSITLTTSTPGEGQFQLLVDDQVTTDANGNTVLADPQPVVDESSINSATPFIDNASPTTESGATHNVYMQIVLGTNIHTGTYLGTITIAALDGS